MSRISFRITSIELNDFTLQSINKENLIRLKITQKPSKQNEEYLLKNSGCLKDINHEFKINDPSGKVEKLTMTVRSVVKKPTFANFFNLDNNAPKKKTKDHSVDHFIDRSKENRNDHVECEYIEPIHSLIGYCTINLKEITKGVNNSIRVELLTKEKENVVGYANLEIYTWNYLKTSSKENNSQIKNEQILFVDPGCPTTTVNPVVF